jgi:hypothetical protein
MPFLVQKLQSFGIKVILDIDDYWEVSKEHPLYHAVKKDGLKEKIVANLKIIDAVSTTTPVYENYIKPYNKNILVIPNGINRNLKEWKPANDKCSYDKMRILYLAGSSHLQDVSLLKDCIEKLVDDVSVANKFQFHLSGFDLRGTTTNYSVNEDFIKEIQAMGIFNEQLYKKLIANNFDVINTPEIPREIVQKYNGNVLTENTQPIKPQDTVWTRYEEIFTSNYKLIKDKDYYDFLMKFDLDAVYEKQSEQNYFRHKTQGLYKFAANYKHGDVALAPNKVYGRKCVIKEVIPKEAKMFLENNHIQGNVNSKVRLGLYYNNKLVSLMTFGGLRKNLGNTSNENIYELFRFCNLSNHIIIGGADKLFKHFIKHYKPKEIISYADRRWSQGDLYNKLNFIFSHNTKPNYFYLVNDKRENRFNYRKDILVTEGFDKNKTEHDIMLERKLYRIYDCGSICFKIKMTD